jgi:hypothetical protein
VSNRRRPPRQRSKRLQERTSKQTALGFKQGIEAAREAIAPIMMRRFFLRGLTAGAVFAIVVITAVVGALTFYGIVVLRWTS